jgi:hypothetical protein
MFHPTFYSVLMTVFNLAFAILPSAPLFTLQKLSVEKSRSAYRPRPKNRA